MTLMPRLCTVASSLRRLSEVKGPESSRTRALDVGGGVGRTTQDVLLHLVDEVILVEPVNKVRSSMRQ
jgi:protein N-terminal methyltransferase